MSDAVLVEHQDGLVTVTFNRPHRKNALNAESWLQLDAALTQAERDPSCRALVLTGPDAVVRWSHVGSDPGEIPGANLIFDALAALER